MSIVGQLMVISGITVGFWHHELQRHHRTLAMLIKRLGGVASSQSEHKSPGLRGDIEGLAAATIMLLQVLEDMKSVDHPETSVLSTLLSNMTQFGMMAIDLLSFDAEMN